MARNVIRAICRAMANSRRIFVALPIPEAVQETLLDTMEGLPGARWQDADNLHLTLRFIGEVDRHTFADVCTALETVPFRPVNLRVSGVGHFEGRKRARAIWAAVESSQQLIDLQHSVEMACRRAGLPAETRKFTPHITIARLNSGSESPSDWLRTHGKLASQTWIANSIALFESHLTNQGALYQKIAQFP